MSTTYNISQNCLSGGKLQVSGPPLWPLSKVFGKCTEVSVGSLRGGYLSSTASYHQEVVDHTKCLTEHSVSQGFKINLERSFPLLSHIILFIGLFMDSTQARVRRIECL